MVQELGRLLFDVKVDVVKGDKRVLNNRIAVQQTKDKKTFIDIVAWDGTADLIGTYYQKGYEILVSGQLINKKMKKGEVEYDTVAILVDKVIFTNGNPKKENEDTPDFLK